MSDLKICPLLGELCVKDNCHMWGNIDWIIDPEWEERRKKVFAEYAKKSWWYRFWWGRYPPMPFVIPQVPVKGCTLKKEKKR